MGNLEAGKDGLCSSFYKSPVCIQCQDRLRQKNIKMSISSKQKSIKGSWWSKVDLWKNRWENVPGLLTALLQLFAAQWLLSAKVASEYLVKLFLFLFSELIKTPLEPMWTSIICSIHGKVLHSLTKHCVKNRFCKQNPFAALTLCCLMLIPSSLENCTHPELRLCTNVCCEHRWPCQNPLQDRHYSTFMEGRGIAFLYYRHWKDRWNILLILKMAAVNNFMLLDAPEIPFRNLSRVIPNSSPAGQQHIES